MAKKVRLTPGTSAYEKARVAAGGTPGGTGQRATLKQLQEGFRERRDPSGKLVGIGRTTRRGKVIDPNITSFTVQEEKGMERTYFGTRAQEMAASEGGQKMVAEGSARTNLQATPIGDTTQAELPLQQERGEQQQLGIFENLGQAIRQVEQQTLIGTVAQAFSPELSPVEQSTNDRVRGMFQVGGLAALGSVLAGAGALTIPGTMAATVGTTTALKATATGGKVSYTYLTGPAVNPKSVALSSSILKKVFSTKAMLIMGGWASAVFLGRWGKAEGPEAIAIPLRDAVRQAQQTGDWSIYDEYYATAREMTEESTWDSILQYSPTSAITGTTTKIKGVREGVELINAIAEKAKSQ